MNYEARSLDHLETALSGVPAYLPWRPSDPGPGRPWRERYAALPILTKAGIRDHGPEGFLSPGCEREAGLREGIVEEVRTSGSTEDAVVVLWNQQWWNASERASWSLNAHTRAAGLGDHREAILSSPLCVGRDGGGEALSFEERVEQRFLFLNEERDPSRWTPERMDRMAGEIDRFRPATLEANPAMLARLARHIHSRGLRVRPPGVIVFTYEAPSRLHRRQIARVFDCPMASSYGSTEAGYVFMECERGRLHQNAEFCHVDFVPLKPEHGGPRTGRIFVTTFANSWFRVLRFNIGDLVRLADGPCPCGRRDGLTLEAIEGRARDLTRTADGRAVTLDRLDAALAEVQGLAAYRVEQTAPGAYRARFVDGTGGGQSVGRAAAAALETLYGPRARVTWEMADDIPIEPYGKHRFARSYDPPDIETLTAAP
jgi:phenylacetate-CoA ligase